jgi:hypothetical protein
MSVTNAGLKRRNNGKNGFNTLWKECLNSDRQKVHRYKKTSKVLSPEFTEHKKKQTPRHMTFEIQVLVCDRHRHVAVLNRLMTETVYYKN